MMNERTFVSAADCIQVTAGGEFIQKTSINIILISIHEKMYLYTHTHSQIEWFYGEHNETN